MNILSHFCVKIKKNARFSTIRKTIRMVSNVISTKAVYGCVGNDPSGDPVGHSPKAKMRWSPDARGARGGNSARGACAFPYRSKQRVEASAMPAALTEIADGFDTVRSIVAARAWSGRSGGIPLRAAISIVALLPWSGRSGGIPLRAATSIVATVHWTDRSFRLTSAITKYPPLAVVMASPMLQEPAIGEPKAKTEPLRRSQKAGTHTERRPGK